MQNQPMPHDHAKNLCTYHAATEEMITSAIDGALAGKTAWEEMAWADRAAIFLKAADLIAGKYRFEVMAATMLGQGKNAWQAEIDAAAEVRIFPVEEKQVTEDEVVVRFLPVQRQVRRGDVRATTAAQLRWGLEVGTTLISRIHADCLQSHRVPPTGWLCPRRLAIQLCELPFASLHPCLG